MHINRFTRQKKDPSHVGNTISRQEKRGRNNEDIIVSPSIEFPNADSIPMNHGVLFSKNRLGSWCRTY